MREELATTDMNIRFLAPCQSDATAEAKIIKVGRTLCPVSVEVRDAQQVLVAVAQVTYMRLRQLQAVSRNAFQDAYESCEHRKT